MDGGGDSTSGGGKDPNEKSPAENDVPKKEPEKNAGYTMPSIMSHASAYRGWIVETYGHYGGPGLQSGQGSGSRSPSMGANPDGSGPGLQSEQGSGSRSPLTGGYWANPDATGPGLQSGSRSPSMGGYVADSDTDPVGSQSDVSRSPSVGGNGPNPDASGPSVKPGLSSDSSYWLKPCEGGPPKLGALDYLAALAGLQSGQSSGSTSPSMRSFGPDPDSVGPDVQSGQSSGPSMGDADGQSSGSSMGGDGPDIQSGQSSGSSMGGDGLDIESGQDSVSMGGYGPNLDAVGPEFSGQSSTALSTATGVDGPDNQSGLSYDLGDAVVPDIRFGPGSPSMGGHGPGDQAGQSSRMGSPSMGVNGDAGGPARGPMVGPVMRPADVRPHVRPRFNPGPPKGPMDDID